VSLVPLQHSSGSDAGVNKTATYVLDCLLRQRQTLTLRLLLFLKVDARSGLAAMGLVGSNAALIWEPEAQIRRAAGSV
jgi:hypothetical protein